MAGSRPSSIPPKKAQVQTSWRSSKSLNKKKRLSTHGDGNGVFFRLPAICGEVLETWT